MQQTTTNNTTPYIQDVPQFHADAIIVTAPGVGYSVLTSTNRGPSRATAPPLPNLRPPLLPPSNVLSSQLASSALLANPITSRSKRNLHSWHRLYRGNPELVSSSQQLPSTAAPPTLRFPRRIDLEALGSLLSSWNSASSSEFCSSCSSDSALEDPNPVVLYRIVIVS